MKMVDNTKDEIIEKLSKVPNQLDVDDIADMFYVVEQLYISLTPSSIKEYHSLIFTPSVTEPSLLKKNLAQSLCLPVPVWDILPDAKNRVQYFVVDCRPPDQYNNGHLSTAFHLDCGLMLSDDRDAFKLAVEGLKAVQEQAIEAKSVAGGQHLCFMGSGRDEEDQYVHMAVSWFLQNQNQYVSLADGGFQALHKVIKVEDVDKYITDHNPKKCLACLEQKSSQVNNSLKSSLLPMILSSTSNGDRGTGSASGSASNSDAESTR